MPNRIFRVSNRSNLLLGFVAAILLAAPFAVRAQNKRFKSKNRAIRSEIKLAANNDVLKTLRRTHPRVFITDADVAAIKSNIERDAVVKAWFERVKARGEAMLKEPIVKYETVGPRLLEQSRLALRHITTLAALYRLSGDKQFAARAREEMLAAAAFKDWNPSHFLDTAEMTNALGIGYDWLFDYLNREDKQIVRAAIVEKGLREGIQAFERKDGWTEGHSNWNQVCNGGLTVGALSVADEEPEIAAKIINFGRRTIGQPMRLFAPDGGYEEGPGYWSYGTRYNVFYLAALKSALGTDFGFGSTPGLRETGEFRAHFVAPTNKLVFNFADGNETPGGGNQMFWFAREYNLPVYARHERAVINQNADVFHLLWSNAPGASGDAAEKPIDLPTDKMFSRVNVAFFRSAWNDARAAFVGFKGGDNQFSHGHLDLGTFVFDQNGERWALDLPPDDYNLPGYWDGKTGAGKRWNYYRLNTFGHNTLLIDDENQEATAKAPLVAFLSTRNRAFAVADLTQAYAPKVAQARRGVALLDRRAVLVQDEIVARAPVSIVWQMHTRAKIEINNIDSRQSVLTQNGETLDARILQPTNARFDVMNAVAPPPNAKNENVRKLIVRLPDKSASSRIVVLLRPRGANEPARAMRIEPLANWIKAGRLIGNKRF